MYWKAKVTRSGGGRCEAMRKRSRLWQSERLDVLDWYKIRDEVGNERREWLACICNRRTPLILNDKKRNARDKYKLKRLTWIRLKHNWHNLNTIQIELKCNCKSVMHNDNSFTIALDKGWSDYKVTTWANKYKGFASTMQLAIANNRRRSYEVQQN